MRKNLQHPSDQITKAIFFFNRGTLDFFILKKFVAIFNFVESFRQTLFASRLANSDLIYLFSFFLRIHRGVIFLYFHISIMKLKKNKKDINFRYILSYNIILQKYIYIFLSVNLFFSLIDNSIFLSQSVTSYLFTHI